MLDIKKVLPKNAIKEAVYVTEDNVKEFIEYAFSNVVNIDTLSIDKSEYPYIYASVEYQEEDCEWENLLLNLWYIGSGSKGNWLGYEHGIDEFDFVGE